MTVTLGQAQIRSEHTVRSGRAWAALAALELIVFLTTASFYPIVSDSAWLLTLAERFLDGAVLYVDLIEVNPPMSVFIYVPLVAATRAIGIAPDPVLPFYAAAVMVLSLTVSGHILRRARLINEIMVWWVVGFAAMALFPLGIYSQREQFAVAFMLPGIALVAARMVGWSPRAWVAFGIAVATGLGACVKPHFALAIAIPTLIHAYRSGSLKPLFFPEHLVAAVVVSAYGAIVFVFFPAFVRDLLPLLAEIYLPMGHSVAKMLFSPHSLAVYCCIAAAYLAAGRGRRSDALFLTLLGATLGYFAAFVIQGKGWAYQNLPTMTVGLTAVLWYTVERFRSLGSGKPSKRDTRDLILVYVLVLFGIGLVWRTFAVPTIGQALHLSKTLWSLQGASVNTITSDIALGFPFVRQIDGRWAGRTAYRVVAYGALDQLPIDDDPGRAARLQALADGDRATLLRDLQAERPDIVLAHTYRFNWLVWARVDPDVDRYLRDYVLVERVDGFHLGYGWTDVLARKDYAAAKGLVPMDDYWTRRLGPL